MKIIFSIVALAIVIAQGEAKGSCDKVVSCTLDYRPVCDTRGNTHANFCLFKRARDCRGAVFAHEGKCPVRRERAVKGGECRGIPKCPRNYRPVCGRTKTGALKTYNNGCLFSHGEKCDGATRLYAGQCRSKRSACPMMCHLNYEPVCGTDGVTYGNQCQLDAAICQDKTIAFAKTGECSSGRERRSSCPAICPAIWDPVCGSNGVTYGSKCDLNAAINCNGVSVSKAYDGECNSGRERRSACSFPCQLKYEPVCGTDGVTYGNMCQFEAAKCADPSIGLANTGACSSGRERRSACPNMCPFNYAPVCKNGTTYSNQCELDIAACNGVEENNEGTAGEC